jgi:spermidine/putrescine transport system substrate-binding protein
MMARSPGIVVRSLTLGVFGVAAAAAAEQLPVLHVVNWTYFIDDDPQASRTLPITERSLTLRTFAATRHCTIAYTELENEEEIAAHVLANLDTIDVTTDASDHLTSGDGRNAWLALTTADVPHLADLRPEIAALMSAYDPQHRRVPFTAGNTGILYRRDKLAAAPDSWQALYTEPHAMLVDSPITIFSAGLKQRGLQFATATAEDLALVCTDLRKLLMSGRVDSITADLDVIEKALVNGDSHLALMWSGDGLRMIARHPDIPLAFVVPKEGSEFYWESWLVNPRSPQRALALDFVNYLLEPEVQARLVDSIRYRCVTMSGLAELRRTRPTLANDPAIEPPPEIQARCEDSTALEHFELQGMWTRVCEAASGHR